VEIQGTGVFATPDELVELDTIIAEVYAEDAATTPVIRPGLGPDWGPSEPWERAVKRCHEMALAHGLAEIEGFYGTTADGEFVIVDD